AGRARIRRDAAAVHPLRGEARDGRVPELVAPDPPHERDAPARAGGGDGLVRALPARRAVEAAAAHGLPRRRETLGRDEEMGIAAADDADHAANGTQARSRRSTSRPPRARLALLRT